MIQPGSSCIFHPLNTNKFSFLGNLTLFWVLYLPGHNKQTPWTLHDIIDPDLTKYIVVVIIIICKIQ
jgi:hypothetical protein